MGFYIRKSFSAGPIRINLSKSGLGASAGVRGARVGLSASGRSYVHAGRHGLYYRKQFGGSGRRGSGSAAAVALPPEVHYEETGVTYGQAPAEDESIDESLEPEVRARDAMVVAVVGSVAVTLSAAFGLTGWFGEGILGWGGAAFCVVGLTGTVRLMRREHAARKLRRALAESLRQRRSLTSTERADLAEIIDSKLLDDRDRERIGRSAYAAVMGGVLEDRRIDDDERRLLKQLARDLHLDRDWVAEYARDVFRQQYFAAVADCKLTAVEERDLSHLREQLGVSADDLSDEDEVLGQLAAIREAQDSATHATRASIKLQRGETCLFEDEGRVLKERTLRTYQSEGRKVKVRGLALEKEGRLILTNKRIVFAHDGVTAIPLSKVVDLDVDIDRALMTVARDGVKSGWLVTTPKVLVAGATLAKAAGL